jgi:hypothetical protein
MACYGIAATAADAGGEAERVVVLELWRYSVQIEAWHRCPRTETFFHEIAI